MYSCYFGLIALTIGQTTVGSDRRLESGGRVPTLVVLQKYIAAFGKHIELNICDGVEE